MSVQAPYVRPTYSRDYAPLFVAACGLSGAAKVDRLVELLRWMEADIRRSEHEAADLWRGVLEDYALEGNHLGFLQVMLRLAVALPLDQRRDRVRQWWWRGDLLRSALGRRAGIHVWLLKATIL